MASTHHGKVARRALAKRPPLLVNESEIGEIKESGRCNSQCEISGVGAQSRILQQPISEYGAPPDFRDSSAPCQTRLLWGPLHPSSAAFEQLSSA